MLKKPDTASSKRRAKALAEHLKTTPAKLLKGGAPVNDVNDHRNMMNCLRKKYNEPVSRDLLLSTGDRALHELPLRGKPGKWTCNKDGEGGDMLGKMLGLVRDELRARARLG